MVSKFALLSNLFLVFVALAVPPSQLGARSNESNIGEDPVPIYYPTYNWAGVLMDSGVNGTFNTVMATFAVPTPSGDQGSFSMTIGIDGLGDCSATLQTGVRVSITDGVPSYNAWYAWSSGTPGPTVDFPHINANPGDVFDVYVVATSATTGVVAMANLSAGELSSVPLTSPDESYALCGRHVEWVVQDPQLDDGTFTAFANFTTARFINAAACGPNDISYGPSTGDIAVIVQNDITLTFVTTTTNDILVEYL